MISTTLYKTQQILSVYMDLQIYTLISTIFVYISVHIKRYYTHIYKNIKKNIICKYTSTNETNAFIMELFIVSMVPLCNQWFHYVFIGFIMAPLLSLYFHWFHNVTNGSIIMVSNTAKTIPTTFQYKYLHVGYLYT